MASRQNQRYESLIRVRRCGEKGKGVCRKILRIVNVFSFSQLEERWAS